MSLQALYTVTEVADLLGWSRHKVRRLVDRGVLPHVTFEEGGTRYVPISALRARGMVWDSVLMLQRLRADEAARGNPRSR